MKRALLTAHCKKDLPLIAEHFWENDFELFSLGQTAEVISAAGLPVKPTSDLFTYADVEIPDLLSARGKRNIGAAWLGEMLTVTDEQNDMGLPRLDVAYINLTPPERTHEGHLKIDRSGREMILHAAIEGGKPILVKPEQIADCLTVGINNLSQPHLAQTALRYLIDYQRSAYELL